MIIDLKDKFLELQKLNEAARKSKLEKAYIDKYLEMRKDMRDDEINIPFEEEYQLEDIEELSDWSGIQCLASDIYDKMEIDNSLDYIQDYIDEKCTKMARIPEELEKTMLEVMGEDLRKYFTILLALEDHMIRIANIREEFVKELDDPAYIFRSYFDIITTSDYLRLSLVEDFILKQGAFCEINTEQKNQN